MFSSDKSLHRPFLVTLCLAVTLVVGFSLLHQSGCLQVQAASCLHPQKTTTQDQSQVLALRYWTYSDGSLQQAQQEGKVVLYFWAPWCSSCTSLDIELQDKKKQVPEGVTVLRVDYDKAADLKQKYSVVAQHTFVQIDRSGNELSTWVGGEIENFDKYLK